MAQVIIEAVNTPSVFQFEGTTAELRLYPTKSFSTSIGQLVGQGMPYLNNSWYLAVPLEVQPTNILYQPSFEIPSTIDGFPRIAKWIAGVFDEGGSFVGPWPLINPNGFRIPPIPDTQTWITLAAYNAAPTLLYPPPTFPTVDLVTTMIAAATSQDLRKSSETQVGNTALSVDPTDPTFPIALGINDPLWLEVISGIGSGVGFFFLSNYTDLADAVSTIGSTRATLLIETVADVADDLTIPDTMTLFFTNAGGIEPATGKTITIQGPITSPPFKIFYNSLSGEGTIAFTNNSQMTAYYPQWWGVVGDNATDDQPALQACSDAVPNYTRIVIPSRCYMRVDNTWTIQNKQGLEIDVPSGNGSVGAIGNNSMLRWGGAANGTVFKLLDSRGLKITGLTVVPTNSDSTDHADIGIDIDQSDPIVTGITSDIIIDRCLVDFTNNSSTSVCCRISEVSAQNVEQIKIWNTAMYGAGDPTVTNVNRGVGVKVGANDNAKNIEVVDCQIQNCAIGQWFRQGSFYSARNLTEQNTIEYKVEGLADPSIMDGNLGEGARQFLVMPTGGGLLTIRSNNFGFGSTNVAFPWLDITSNAGTTIIFEGNSFDTTGFETIPVFGTGPGFAAALLSAGNLYGVSDIATIGFEFFNRGASSINDLIFGEGGGTQSSGSRVRVHNSTSSIGGLSYYGLYTIDATGGNRVFTLPSANDPGLKGLTFTVKKTDISGNTVTVSGDVNIDGAGSVVLATQWDYVTVVLNAAGNLWLKTGSS